MYFMRMPNMLLDLNKSYKYQGLTEQIAIFLVPESRTTSEVQYVDGMKSWIYESISGKKKFFF
jgi:hypothetical protein